MNLQALKDNIKLTLHLNDNQQIYLELALDLAFQLGEQKSLEDIKRVNHEN